MRRGEWPTPRTAKMPEAPWPDPDNPMLAALLHDARANADRLGTDAAFLQLAAHCWFEGGIEGHDRGRRDAGDEANGADGEV